MSETIKLNWFSRILTKFKVGPNHRLTDPNPSKRLSLYCIIWMNWHFLPRWRLIHRSQFYKKRISTDSAPAFEIYITYTCVYPIIYTNRIGANCRKSPPSYEAKGCSQGEVNVHCPWLKICPNIVFWILVIPKHIYYHLTKITIFIVPTPFWISPKSKLEPPWKAPGHRHCRPVQWQRANRWQSEWQRKPKCVTAKKVHHEMMKSFKHLIVMS